MTEEVKPTEGKEVEKVEAKQEAPQTSPIEEKALAMGWRPKEEFEGSEDDFIDAKEFVRRQPLFDKIENTTKEVKQLKKAIEALKTHYSAKEEAAVRAALSRLEEARKEAISNADGDAFEKVDKQIKQVEAEAAKIRQINQEVQTQNEPDPRFVSWAKRNAWYESSESMRAYADRVGQKLAGSMDPVQVLEEVEKAVRKEFPERFRNPNKAAAPDAENNKNSASGRKSGSDDFELSDQERRIMNTLVSTKTMTKEEYIRDLKIAKGIK